MNAHLLAPWPYSSSVRRYETREPALSLQVAITISVNADTRRIFQVLTLPEYMEAWVCMPGNDSRCHLEVTQSADCFRMDHYREGDVDVTVTGSYRICRRGKLLFTWRKNGVARPESLVLIRLYGNFARSTLCLSHSGLSPEPERRWHENMWNRSLRNLQSLFELHSF